MSRRVHPRKERARPHRIMTQREDSGRVSSGTVVCTVRGRTGDGLQTNRVLLGARPV